MRELYRIGPGRRCAT